MVRKRDIKPLMLLLFLLLTFKTINIPNTSSEDDKHNHTYTLFHDDFETGEAADWTINIPPEAPHGSSMTIELVEGNHVLCSRGQTWAETGESTWTNYTITVRLKMLSPESGNHISVRRSGSSRYFVQIWMNSLGLSKEHMGTFTQLEERNVYFQTNKWYNIKTVCLGNAIHVYVDDVLRLTYVDEVDPILTGNIVLESCPGSVTHFDDVTVLTNLRLYVDNLLQNALEEVNTAEAIGAEVKEAEQRLSEAQLAFQDGDLSSATSLAEEAISLAKCAPVGTVSVDTLFKYPKEYDQHLVGVSGIIRDIRYDSGVYGFVVDDGSGVISCNYNKSLGEIKTDCEVEASGRFNVSTMTITVDSLQLKSAGEYYTYLVFKDDYESGDLCGWMSHVESIIPGSLWEIEKEGQNRVLCGEGRCGV